MWPEDLKICVQMGLEQRDPYAMSLPLCLKNGVRPSVGDKSPRGWSSPFFRAYQQRYIEYVWTLGKPWRKLCCEYWFI